jgi:DNA-binding MarR family transcriptional regulator
VTLDYLHIPVSILKLADLNLRQKLLLALVVSFGDRGLRSGNLELAEILGVLPTHVSELFYDLEARGYVEIKNRHSRYRIIYYRPKSTVGDILLSTKSESSSILLSTFDRSTIDQSRNITKELKRCAHKARKPVYENDTFLRFWTLYPKKQKKVEAQRIWDRLKPDAELAEQIIKDVQRRSQIHDWQKENGKYIPMPTTYLNGQRWTDELPEPKRGDPDWLPSEEEVEASLQGGGL